MLEIKIKWLFFTAIFNLCFSLFSQTFSSASSTVLLTLKQQENLEGRKEFFLDDVVEEVLTVPFHGIKLGTVDENVVKLTAEDIMSRLSDIKGYNIIVSGNYVLVSSTEEIESTKIMHDKMLPLECLKSHMESFLDRTQFHLEIAVRKTIPECSLDAEYDEICWQLPKVRYGLQDLEKFRNLTVVLDGKKVKTLLDIKLYSWIYLSKVKQKKDELLKESNFIRKYCDITLLENRNSLVYDFAVLKPANYVFEQEIGGGSVLTMEQIKRLPDICTGEKVIAVMTRGGIELKIPVSACADGFIGKSVSVQTEDKKKLSGYLRQGQSEGELYVEIH